MPITLLLNTMCIGVINERREVYMPQIRQDSEQWGLNNYLLIDCKKVSS